MNQVNATGEAFFSHTKLNGKYVIRWVIGQTDVTEKHIQKASQNKLSRLDIMW